MSGVIIAGNTSGSVTLDAPAVSGSTVITLPTVSGTMATLTTPSFTTTIGVGNATPSTSGAGITFPATQSPSTNANTLDDYEEGTWTPTDGSGAGLSITFNNPTYTKIGNLVYVKCSTIVYPTTASGTGAKISGLPFTNSAGDTGTAALVSGSTFATRGLVLASDTGIFLYPNTGAVQATNANMSASTTYGLCAVYRV